MPNLNFNYRSKPTDSEPGIVGRTASRGMLGGVVGGVVGAAAGWWLAIPAGPLAWAGAIVLALAGAGWGASSSDPEKVQNRPVSIVDPLFGGSQTVYISAEQWRDVKAKLAQGLQFDEFPPSHAKQFEAAEPPAPAKDSK